MRFLAILTVKNEAAFLIDWLAHHRATGFTDFLVLSNDCSDGTDAMLDRLQEMGWLTHIRNDGPHDDSPQWSALKKADAHPLKADADWILFFDIDEYVNIHVGDRTLPALVSALPEASAITLTWRLFGNPGVIRYEDRPVTEVFTRAAPRIHHWPWRAAMFKTLFRNDGIYRKLGVHRPKSPDKSRLSAARWFDGSGRALPAPFLNQRIFSDFGRDNHAMVQLNHYALGAMESYLVKCDRGRANRTDSTFDMSYWVERNLCDEDDRSIGEMAAQSAPLRAELMADPALSALHAQAVAWRHRRFTELMTEESWRGLFGRLLMAPPSRALDPEQSELVFSHARQGQSGPAQP